LTALKIIGIILLIFLLLGFLRIGALVSFGGALCVKLRVGALWLTVFPKEEKKPKKPKEEKPAEESKKPKKEKKEKKGKKHTFPKPTLEEIIDLIKTALAALKAMVRRACSRVRIDPLELTVTFAGDDPSAVAVAYGMASSAMFTLMPKAEETFYIPDPSLHIRMDFTGGTTTAEGSVGISLRLCDLFAILFTLAIPLFQWFLRLKKAHRHDNKAEKSADPTEDKTNSPEDKIA